MVCSGKGMHMYIGIHRGKGMVLMKDDCWKNEKIEKEKVILNVHQVIFNPLG